MKIPSKIIILIFLFFITFSLFGSSIARGSTPLTVKEVEVGSVERSWADLSLLYQNQYHNPEEVIAELHQLNETASDIIDLTVLGQSVQGRDIHLVTITNEQITTPKAGVFIVAQHHAREQISMEAALRFMIRLVNNYGLDETLTQYIDTEEIYIIPTLNPDGLHYVVGNETMPGDPWLRRNLQAIDDDQDGKFDEDHYNDVNADGVISGYDVFSRDVESIQFLYTYYEGIDDDGDGKVNEDVIGGTDLNRNYDYRWNDSSLDSGTGSNTLSRTFPGFAPFSEPETQILRDFVGNHSFSMAMSLHSGINTSYFPWASRGTWAQTNRYYDIYTDLKSILPNYFFQDYLESSLNPTTIQRPSYTSAGEWGDWMYARQNVQVPMTFEIYHKKGSENYGPVEFQNSTHIVYRFDTIEEYFAPPESKIESLWFDVQPAFDYWLETTPQLEITQLTVQGNNSKGSELTVNFKVKNTSPRVTSISQLSVHSEEISLIPAFPVFDTLEEDMSLSGSFKLLLEESLGSKENLTLYLGNSFIGFYPIIIEPSMIGKSSGTFSFIGIIVGIPVLVMLKRRKS